MRFTCPIRCWLCACGARTLRCSGHHQHRTAYTSACGVCTCTDGEPLAPHKPGTRGYWTPAKVVAAFQAFHQLTGVWPCERDLGTNGMPSRSTCYIFFGGLRRTTRAAQEERA